MRGRSESAFPRRAHFPCRASSEMMRRAERERGNRSAGNGPASSGRSRKEQHTRFVVGVPVLRSILSVAAPRRATENRRLHHAIMRRNSNAGIFNIESPAFSRGMVDLRSEKSREGEKRRETRLPAGGVSPDFRDGRRWPRARIRQIRRDIT